MLLLALNGAFYLAEVVRLKWDDIRADGTLVTHRAKTGRMVRVAVLWKETVEALGKVERKTGYIFVSYQGTQLGVKGAEKRWRALRAAAVKQTKDEQLAKAIGATTSSQIRDGAYTSAVESGVSLDVCKVLAGHRSGLPDHYVKRSPQRVAPACEAIRLRYLPQ